MHGQRLPLLWPVPSLRCPTLLVECLAHTSERSALGGRKEGEGRRREGRGGEGRGEEGRGVEGRGGEGRGGEWRGGEGRGRKEEGKGRVSNNNMREKNVFVHVVSVCPYVCT